MTEYVPFTCSDCGAPGLRKARGRPRRRCERCAAALVKASRHRAPVRRSCPTCSGPVEVGSTRTYCSPQCRPNGERECSVCGARFRVTLGGGRKRTTCSIACRDVLQRQANAKPRTARPCTDCGTSVVKFGKAICDSCGARQRREHHQAKNRRRRAVARQADAEPYTLAEIAERDRFRCQLCRRKVNMTLKSPHPRSPSIDHVIPIVEGGGDVRANVQLAHRVCNLRKGARGSQQLALVG